MFALFTLHLLAIAAILTTVDGTIANEVATYAYYFLIVALVGPPLLNAMGRKNIKQVVYIRVWKRIERITYSIRGILLDENLGIFIGSWVISWAILSKLSRSGGAVLLVATFSGLVIASLTITLFEQIPEGKETSS